MDNTLIPSIEFLEKKIPLTNRYVQMGSVFLLLLGFLAVLSPFYTKDEDKASKIKSIVLSVYILTCAYLILNISYSN